MSSSIRQALEALLPDHAETQLLLSCLATGAECNAAWSRFQRGGRQLTELFRTDRGELKRLGPLLLRNLVRNDVAVDAALLTVLRTGYFREELRAKAYLEVFGQVMQTLESSGIQPIVLRGAAFAEPVYGDPALRHSHDIDLLLAESELPRAMRALESAGFARGSPAAGALLIHGNSLPVRLHSALFELTAHPRSLAELAARSRVVRIGGAPARVLAPEDNLAQVLGRAAHSPSRTSLQWACDAWFLLDRHRELDSAALAAALGEARLALSGAVLLRYLEELGAPVPGGLLEAVQARASRSDRLERDLALHGLRRGANGLAGALGRMPRLTTRIAALGWTLLPSLEYLRWAHHPRHGALTPAYYVIRVLRAAGLSRRPASAEA